MEKFSNWRDKGTGISPFMPTPESEKSLVGKLRIVIDVALFSVKVPILIFLCCLYFLLPIQAIGKLIVLAIFGFRKADLSVDGIKRTKVKEIDATRPNTNDLVIVNFISPLDSFILSIISNASYKKTVYLIPDTNGDLFEYSLWSFINNAFSVKFGQPTSTVRVRDLSKYKGKLVYLFAEGTTSNNKAVLPFVDISSLEIPSFFAIKTLVLKFQPNELTLPIPNISKLGYLFRLLTNTNGSSNIRVKLFNHDSFDLKEIKKSFELSALNLIGNDLNIEQKEKFYNYFIDYEVQKN